MEANAEPKHGNNSTEKQPVRFSTRTTETSKQWRERRNKTDMRLLARLVSLARATLVHRTQDSSLPALVRAYQQQCRVGAGTTTGGKDSAHPSQSTLHRPQAPSHAMGNLGDSSHAAGRPATPLLVQRQWVGDKLFSAIARFRPEFAGKVARMMLEMDNAVLLTLLKYEQQLMIKAEEAMRLLAPAVTFRSGAHAQARASSSTTAGPAQATGTACSITNSGFVYWSTGGAFCSITSYKALGVPQSAAHWAWAQRQFRRTAVSRSEWGRLHLALPSHFVRQRWPRFGALWGIHLALWPWRIRLW